MAKDAGVKDVWAKYGVAQDRPEYELLRRVTHWSRGSVEQEKAVEETKVKPAYTLDKSFGEVIEMFDFAPFIDPIRPDDKDKKEKGEAIVEIWKKTIDVQQHFNDIELRIRNYALTVLVAVLGASGFALKENMRIALLGLSLPLAVLLLLAGLVVWTAFYFMDRFWYHRLLYGAVNQGRYIEARARLILPEMGLTGAIADASPFEICNRKIRSSQKIDLFYGTIAAILLLLAFLSLFVGRADVAQSTRKQSGKEQAVTEPISRPEGKPAIVP